MNKPIKTITGANTRVLIIAPHWGETGTAKIAKKTAKFLSCPAIINEQIKRSNLDLNNYKKSKKHGSYHNFLRAWAGIEHEEHPLAIWVHGHGLKKGPMCVVGYGQPDSKSAKTEIVETLMTELRGQDVESVEAVDGFKKYAARSKNTMAQFFRREGVNVDSIQLELSKQVRGMFADDFAKALSKSIEKIINPPKDVSLVKALAQKPVIITQVEEAASHVLQICGKHALNAMIEVGHYFVKSLFNGEIERARNPRSSIGDDSFHIVCKRVHDQGGPSIRWLYNSLKLVVNEHDYGSFAEYAKLSLSHKVELFRLDNKPKVKKKLIRKDADRNLSIDKLRYLIRDESNHWEIPEFRKPTLEQREARLITEISYHERVIEQKRAELKKVQQAMGDR